MGALALLFLAYRAGAGKIVDALAHVTWWQFAVVCLIQGIAVALDAYGWRYAFATDRVPFRKLLAARCAGDAINVLSAVASVGGEAVKAWVLRHEVSYAESVPSLIVSKTAEVVAQVLLLAVAVLVASTTAAVGPAFLGAMWWLLLVEVIGVGGFVAVQIGGVVGRAGRIVRWAGAADVGHAQRLDAALRGFYRDEWRRLLVAVAVYFLGWVLGVLEALVILWSLGLHASLVTATIIEALWSAVRFATFFVPASLGPLEGASAAAFGALGFGASAGLAFTLVRRARQAVWIAIGVVVLVAMRPTRAPNSERAEAAGSPAERAPRYRQTAG